MLALFPPTVSSFSSTSSPDEPAVFVCPVFSSYWRLGVETNDPDDACTKEDGGECWEHFHPQGLESSTSPLESSPAPHDDDNGECVPAIERPAEYLDFTCPNVRYDVLRNVTFKNIQEQAGNYHTLELVKTLDDLQYDELLELGCEYYRPEYLRLGKEVDTLEEACSLEDGGECWDEVLGECVMAEGWPDMPNAHGSPTVAFVPFVPFVPYGYASCDDLKDRKGALEP